MLILVLLLWLVFAFLGDLLTLWFGFVVVLYWFTWLDIVLVVFGLRLFVACCLKWVFLFMFWVFCLACAVGGLLILVSVPGGFDLLSSLLVCFCLIVLVTRFFA